MEDSIRKMGVTELLGRLVSIDSSFPNEREMGEFLEDYLKKSGFSVERQYVTRERFNVLAEKGGFKGKNIGKAILFYGHMDTVPACSEWKNPLEPRIEDGRLIGLGSHDMKSGIAAILKAVEDANTEGSRIKVAFGVDEENISAGSYRIAESGWLDDVGLIIVPEVASSDDKADTNSITLGRRGRTVIRISVRGKSSHGAMPGKGVSALIDASRIVIAMKNIAMEEHDKLGKGVLCPLSLVSSAESLSVPDKAEILIDRHFCPPMCLDSVVDQIRKEVKKLNLESETRIGLLERENPYLEPYIITKNDRFVRMVMELLKNRYKEEAKVNYGLSVADENRLAMYTDAPIITIYSRGGNPHAVGEWADLRSLEELVIVFKEIIHNHENMKNP